MTSAKASSSFPFLSGNVDKYFRLVGNFLSLGQWEPASLVR